MLQTEEFHRRIPPILPDGEKPEMSEDSRTTPESDLAGLIYGTTIDSALWVRLLSEIFNLNQAGADAGMVDAAPNSIPNRTFETTLFHISQANAIAEKMLDYREAGQFLEQSLASLSCGLAFFDDLGDSLWSNHEMLALLDASGSGTDISTTKLTIV